MSPRLDRRAGRLAAAGRQAAADLRPLERARSPVRPGSLALLGTGLLGLAFIKRRRRG
ncbi:MAG: PEP-CTERM sorting domain-containing protein [Acetobacteraceae bacterium]